MIKKIIKFFTFKNLVFGIKIQEIPSKYESVKYQNLIDILYEQCLDGLSENDLNKIIRKSFYGKTNYSALTFLVKDSYRQKDGALICRLCGRDDLIDCQYTGYKPKGFVENIATIEHIIPKSKGGLKYNPSNMTITCYKCNNKRGVREIKKIDDLHYVIVD
jgi:5-methylcytosine-specific restriction endonuclease McrA